MRQYSDKVDVLEALEILRSLGGSIGGCQEVNKSCRNILAMQMEGCRGLGICSRQVKELPTNYGTATDVG
jgi:hypothetical protein